MARPERVREGAKAQPLEPSRGLSPSPLPRGDPGDQVILQPHGAETERARARLHEPMSRTARSCPVKSAGAQGGSWSGWFRT